MATSIFAEPYLFREFNYRAFNAWKIKKRIIENLKTARINFDNEAISKSCMKGGPEGNWGIHYTLNLFTHPTRNCRVVKYAGSIIAHPRSYWWRLTAEIYTLFNRDHALLVRSSPKIINSILIANSACASIFRNGRRDPDFKPLISPRYQLPVADCERALRLNKTSLRDLIHIAPEI